MTTAGSEFDGILRRKNDGAVDLHTIPCEPWEIHYVQGKPYFYNNCLCFNEAVYARFEDLRTFLYVFRSLTIMGKCTSRHGFPKKDCENHHCMMSDLE